MKKSGTILAFNVSPKGFHEGLLLKSGKVVVQINFSKENAESFGGDALKLGEHFTADVALEEPRGTPEHKVFRLLRRAGPAANKPDHGKFSSRIESLNYALHGEVNGGILESGDFLHLKPEGARALSLHAGMLVKGKGTNKPMVGGHSVIEAEEVNGIAIQQRKPAKKHGPKHAHSH